MMSTLLQDLRYGLRGIAKNPLFSAVVVLTLGLGIGANTTIYSVVDGLVFNPFPFPEPSTLVAVGSEYPQLNQPLDFVEHMAPAEFVDIRDQARTLTDVVAWDMGNRQIATEMDAVNVLTGFWWGDAFPALRVQPRLGRGFSDEETLRGDRVAVISHGLWQTNFGADEQVIGTLQKGDCFGEMGYLSKIKRTATVTAKEPVSTIKVNATLIEQVSSDCQLRFYRVFLRVLIDRLAKTTAMAVRR